MYDEELISLVESLVEVCKSHTTLIKDLQSRVKELEDVLPVSPSSL